MTKMKPEDTKAAEIQFGVELETFVPMAASLEIGGYHCGRPVRQAMLNGEWSQAPNFQGATWKAERDGSLVDGPTGYVACEFVSPILKGDEGVRHLIEFVKWIKSIGGKVTQSCGMHVHVGVRSVLPPGASADETVNYLCKLGAVCQRLGLAFYAQTGAARHQNRFCRPLSNGDKAILDDAKRSRDEFRKLGHLDRYDKYRLLNLRTINSKSTVEFRAFAGTLNTSKVLHHLASALGACRYAAVVSRAQWGVNTKNWWKDAGNGENALRLLWAVFGWQAASFSSTHSFGLFGTLYSAFAEYHTTALKLSQKFDQKFPNTVLTDEATSVFGI